MLEWEGQRAYPKAGNFPVSVDGGVVGALAAIPVRVAVGVDVDFVVGIEVVLVEEVVGFVVDIEVVVGEDVDLVVETDVVVGVAEDEELFCRH